MIREGSCNMKRLFGLRQQIFTMIIVFVLICTTLTACGKSEKVTAVETIIEKINGEVTIDNASDVYAAEQTFNELSENEKKAVANRSILTNAVNSLEEVVADQKHIVFEQLNNIVASGTTEMAYYLIAWQFTFGTPDWSTMDPKAAYSNMTSRWNDFVQTMSVFGIEVTFKEAIEALTFYEGDTAKELDKNALGMLLATEPQYAVEVAKYIYEKNNPLGLSTDYDSDLKKAYSELSKLSFLENDDEYTLLNELYEKAVSMNADISTPKGSFEDNNTRLEEYRDISLKCVEVFKKE